MNNNYIIRKLEDNRVIFESLLKRRRKMNIYGDQAQKNGVYWKLFVIYLMKNVKILEQG